MRALLQNCDTLEYLTPDGTWTPNDKCARVFPSSLDALYYMGEKKLDNVQIVTKFANDRYDFVTSKSEGCD
jgi:hypothetical protein